MSKRRKKAKPATYTLTVTGEQAAVLSDACELLSRIRIGQIWAALDRLPLPDGEFMISSEVRSAVERDLSPSVGFDMTRQSLGIRNDAVDSSGKIAFYLHQLIRHRLSWDRAVANGVIAEGQPRDWSKMMGVHYDNPMPYGDEALIAKCET